MVAALACQAPELEWIEAEGYRYARLTVSGTEESGFTALTSSSTRIRFDNAVPESLIVENQHVLNGSGVALGDVDGDGRVDVFLASIAGPNRLYRNRGRFKFQDISDSAGIGMPDRMSTGAVFVDLDADHDLDLLVSTLGGANSLFINNGSGHFTELVFDQSRSGSTTMAVADIEGDGDLDVYVVNYKAKTVRDLFAPEVRSFSNVVEERDGEFLVRPEFTEHYDLEVQRGRVMRLERGEPDRLFLNDGAGNLSAVDDFHAYFVPSEEPADVQYDWGLAARFYDIDGDGDPDLYVCNDFESPDRFWLNDGTGRFFPADPLAQRKSSQSSMAVDFADIDRDGDVDFFVADMLSRDSIRRRTQNPITPPEQRVVGQYRDRPQEQRNTLFVNRGDGTFAEVARQAGVDASGWSWASLFLDVDLDGYEDLLIGTGYGHDAMDSDTHRMISRGGLQDWRREILAFPPLPSPNAAFRNLGDGTFEDVSDRWGFSSRDITNGVAAADLDGDGDLDLVMNRQGEDALVLRNNASGGRVHIRLRGSGGNTEGIGASVSVFDGLGAVALTRQVTAGGIYLSHSDPALVFATGILDSVTATIRWPSGVTTTLRLAANHAYEIEELDAEPEPAVERRSAVRAAPGFVDVSSQLAAEHTERFYDDEVRQPLIPFSLSQLGPGLTWHDVDSDGFIDLVVPSGVGGRLTWYRNERGQFSPRPIGAETDLDYASVLPWADGSLLVSVMNHEAISPDEADAASSVLRMTRGGRSSEMVPGARPTAGPLAIADIDNDGDLDLFLGRRAQPAAYPVGSASELYRNDGGTLALDTANARVLLSVQRASDAVFSDIDNDGDQDLIVAVDLGSVRVYRNNLGRFADVTRQVGLEQIRGRWNGVTVGDFNNDGLFDIVATNWGTNTWYHVTRETPLRIQFGDLDNNGSFDIVESDVPVGTRFIPVASIERFANGLPLVLRSVTSTRDFALLSTEDLLSGIRARMGSLEVTTLQHMVFLNRGSSFEAVPLPPKAQVAPAFGVVVADSDGDGDQDIFLAHNLFATPAETGRLDAGRGLWLQGDGTGRFTPWEQSGVEVYGEQRGAAVADFDNDGRVDLAVAQNGAEVKLFRNTTAAPGVRVVLRGWADNPLAIGAKLNLFADGVDGPAYEIRAGGGYWSMNSPVAVLGGLSGGADSVRVHWPGGGVTTAAAVAGQTLVLAAPAR